MKKQITVNAPATGWRVDNIEAPGNGKITMSNTASARALDESGRYEVEFERPAKGSRRPVTPVSVFDTKTGNLYTPDEMDIIIR